ncbi:unnamed protein product [Vicia faba]|uniref:BZIP domain-containing protein n=1 Tax=Vicia faba TaxID=3906 RepID=A0AAV0ZQM6_VICFA|nr:unnamed protein product [Vicia faba]
MACSGGNSSASTKFGSSGSEKDLNNLMDERKNKRKQSNRESAKRSRMRKQKHVDDMMNQVSDLTKENNEIVNKINITTQHYLNVEADNSILRAQIGELSQRFQSLNNIIELINTANNGSGSYDSRDCYETSAQNMMNMMVYNNNQPITTSADVFKW